MELSSIVVISLKIIPDYADFILHLKVLNRHIVVISLKIIPDYADFILHLKVLNRHHTQKGQIKGHIQKAYNA